MGGIVGRLFREFAVTSERSHRHVALVSLTVTPMMCARFSSRSRRKATTGFTARASAGFNALLAAYERGVRWVLKHQPLTLAATIATVCLSVLLYYFIPKGFFPQQDIGSLGGAILGAQDISFDMMDKKEKQYSDIVMTDPAVEGVTCFVGGSAMNSGRLIVHLKPLAQRNVSADQVIERLRAKLAVVPGGDLFLQAHQDISVGGRQSNSQFQFTLESEDLDRTEPLGAHHVGETQDSSGAARCFDRSAGGRT